jgi:hypothetical protein
VYTSHGYTRSEAIQHSSAERADCHDGVENAPGSVFPDAPRRLET